MVPDLNTYRALLSSSKRLEGGMRLRGQGRRVTPNTPIVTVITVVRNGERHLEEAIRSVLSQDYAPIEYIIVDGGSTDGTLDIIKRYETSIDYWLSEPDKGIYDAMNKGIALSTGDLVNLLNSDDKMTEGCVSRVVQAYLGISAQERNRTIICSDLEYIDESGKTRPISPPRKANWFWKRDMPGHPSWYVPRATYKQLGLYDVSYRISSDQEFYLRARAAGIHFKRLSPPLAVFRDGGAHSDVRTAFECYRIYKPYFGFWPTFLSLVYELPGRIASAASSLLPRRTRVQLRNRYHGLRDA